MTSPLYAIDLKSSSPETADLGRADSKRIRRMSLSECAFRKNLANLQEEMDLKIANLRRADLKNVYLERTGLVKSVLQRVDLRRVELRNLCPVKCEARKYGLRHF